MKIWICDTSDRRAWEVMVPDHGRARWKPSIKPGRPSAFIDDQTGRPLKRPGIMLVHPEPARQTIKAMIRWANDTEIPLITISGGDRWGCDQPQGAWAYRRQKAVGDEDLDFARRLQLLREELEPQQEPRFDLLEPEPWPLHLVGLQLLVKLLHSPQTRELLEEAWASSDPQWRRDFMGRARKEAASLLPAPWPQRLELAPGQAEEALPSPLTPELSQALGPWCQPHELGPILSGSAGEAASWRGQLRHSWLENLLLNRSASFIGRLHGRTSQSRAAFEARLRPDGEFAQHLAQARLLASQAHSAFSPLRLLDTGPLSAAPSDLRQRLARGLTLASRWEARAPELVAALPSRIDALEQALDDFYQRWLQPHEPPQASLIEENFQHVQALAQNLHQSLGDLPAGVVLP